jgi:hypothetical protein
MAFILGCECGRGVRVEATQAGMTVPCPKCGRSLPVPSLGELRRISLAPDAPRDRSESGEGTATLRIVGVALFLMAFALSFVVGFAAVPFARDGASITPFRLVTSILAIVGALLIIRSKGYPWVVSAVIGLLCPCAAVLILFLPGGDTHKRPRRPDQS